MAFGTRNKITEKILKTWAQKWEALGEITIDHLQKQYNESIYLFNRYRNKKESEHGYIVKKNFDPNETHISSLFDLKVPMLYGYAYQSITRQFKYAEKKKRLAALKSLIYEAEEFNSGDAPHFNLLIFKSLNILVTFLMTQPDLKGDIWKYVIEDGLIYQYFKKLTCETISLKEYLILIKERASELILAEEGNDSATLSMAHKVKGLTLWYYFVPNLSFEIYLYYPKTILPLEFFWKAYHHEVGLSVVGEKGCVHGSTINNTFNMLLHDLFHWMKWVNSRFDENCYREINTELQTYLLSCITNPNTGAVDNFQDLSVFFFLLHEGFYTNLEPRDLFVCNFLHNDELKKLYFGGNPDNIQQSILLSKSENFKIFLGNARKLNAIIALENTTKLVWLLKEINRLLIDKIYKTSNIQVHNITIIELSDLDNEIDEITVNFKYTTEPSINHSAHIEPLFLCGKLTISTMEDDEYNLKIKLEAIDGNIDFKLVESTTLNYKYTRKNAADDYHDFLRLIYPDVFCELPSGVEADPGFVGKGIDRMFVDFYERHKNKFLVS